MPRPAEAATVKHAVDGPYAAALSSDAYRLSCGTFAAFTLPPSVIQTRRDEHGGVNTCVYRPVAVLRVVHGRRHLLGRGHTTGRT